MKRIAFILFVFTFSLVGTGQPEKLHNYLELQHQRIGFNGTVLISKNNKVLHRVNVGKASQELDVPFSQDALFRVASISKQFTALLVALAAEEGRLHLNDSLAMYFPLIKNPQWRRISLQQLLSHTSGIPHNEGIKDYWLLKFRLPLSKEQALAEIFSMNLLFEPGKSMKYSSPGYFLLACILETTYKHSYAEILEEKILHPLKMKHTGVFVTGRIVPGMVPGYHFLDDSLIAAPHRDFSLMKGSGDLYASAEDLMKWNNSFSKNAIWSDHLKKMIFTNYTPKAPYYGYGWFLRLGTKPAYYHGGGNFGCSALSAWYPDEQLSIVILSNVSLLPVKEIWSDIEKIIFKRHFEMPGITKDIKISVAELQKLAGRYVHEKQVVNIQVINDKLYARSGSNPAFEIYPENRYSFYGKKVNIYFSFKADDGGNITVLEAILKDGQIQQFNRE